MADFSMTSSPELHEILFPENCIVSWIASWTISWTISNAAIKFGASS